MRLYETAFLIAPSLPDEEVETLIQQMADIVAKKKGKMVNLEKWGKKKLAYPIEKFTEAFYTFFHYEGEPEIPVELERQFKQIESVIRYLTLKHETGKKPKKMKKKGQKRRSRRYDSRDERPEQSEEKSGPESAEKNVQEEN